MSGVNFREASITSRYGTQGVTLHVPIAGATARVTLPASLSALY